MKRFLLASCLCTITSLQANWNSVARQGIVQFEAVGKPAMIKIKGEAKQFNTFIKIENNGLHLTSELDLSTMTTGIDLRDEHMKDNYLEVNKFPKAKLKIDQLFSEIPSGMNLPSTKNKAFSGTLELHGKSVPINGEFSVDEKNLAQAEFKIKLSDFDIKIPEYLGITVAELVTIKTSIPFEKK
jgi:polyisoprenoid-binding protein YceI